MAQKLALSVVRCSSYDPAYPPSNLHVHSPQSRGWMSARSPPAVYPQELTLACAPSRVSHLQLMSHHSHISRRVEIFVRGDALLGGVGGGALCSPTPWIRVGFFTLDSNVRSHFKTRELRTVNLPASSIAVSQLRLLFHAPHINGLNTYGQIGVVAINAIGQPFAPGVGPASPSAAGLALVDITVDTFLDGDCATLLRQLLVAKARAITKEEYELAKRLKGVESEIKQRGVELAKISAAKRRAVQAEDYDAAMKAQAAILAIRKALIRDVAPFAGIVVPVSWRPDGATPAAVNAARDALEAAGRAAASPPSSAPAGRTLPAPLPPPFGAAPATSNAIFAPRVEGVAAGFARAAFAPAFGATFAQQRQQATRSGLLVPQHPQLSPLHRGGAPAGAGATHITPVPFVPQAPRSRWRPEPLELRARPQPVVTTPPPGTEIPLPGRNGYDATVWSAAGVDDEPPPSTPQLASVSPASGGEWEADARSALPGNASPLDAAALGASVVADAGGTSALADVLAGVPGSERLEGFTPPLRSSGALDEDMVKVVGRALAACVYHSRWHVRELAMLKVRRALFACAAVMLSAAALCASERA